MCVCVSESEDQTYASVELVLLVPVTSSLSSSLMISTLRRKALYLPV